MNRQPLTVSIIVLVLAAFGAATLSAAPAKWIKLGEREVTDRVDHDAIVVGPGKGKFSKLQLRASQSKVRVRRVEITFGDGTRQIRERDFILRKGEKTPVIDLEGARRVIRKVEFTYDEASILRRQAVIHLWGRR